MVARDGTGQNGLYTSELLKQMRVPGQSATDMFMHVRAEVMNRTDKKQVPWEASSLVGAFYFATRSTNSLATLTGDPTKEMKIDVSAVEMSYWDSIKSSTDLEDFNAYIKKYPAGQYADLAKTACVV